MHAIWRLLLDDEFMDAYQNGSVIAFPDGISRRVFPRFFIYSADYPEKYVYHLTILPEKLMHLTEFSLQASST
jgi:hypothetical protein